MRISRARRAELAAQAADIRQRGQSAGWDVGSIVDELARQVPELAPLESWRLAYGWSRPQVVAAVTRFFCTQGLAEPGLTSARVCRWEHDNVQPNEDYVRALVQVFNVAPHRLGFTVSGCAASGGYGQCPSSMWGVGMVDRALSAVTDSVRLQRDVDGPAGGAATREQVAQALDYCSQHYSRHDPAVLAAEIHRLRQILLDMLAQPQHESHRRDLRRLAGWFSALLGNLAFHTGDYAGAHIHLGTGSRLGLDTGEARLTGWSLAAQSMVAWFGNRPAEALELARHAAEHATSPLHRAQVTAWAELRALTSLGRHRDARDAATRAQHHMDAADSEGTGRFGFDRAELHQHLAEAALELGDPRTATDHAEQVRGLKTSGSGGWAAATAILARSNARHGHPDEAGYLAHTVLDTVPAPRLRETTRSRLHQLDTDLAGTRAGTQLRERLRTVPAHAPAAHTSAEPNGH